jgi:DNA-binding GntR family transcriptional regulator
MPVPAGEAVTARVLLRDEAYARMRDAILDGTLEAGERLRDAELSAWLGISRTPIREALARLEDCGLVQSAANRYTRVAPLDRRDAQDAFQVVAALHALAATLGVARVSSGELDTMVAANERFSVALAGGDVDAAVAADDSFHDVLVHAAANGEIARVLERLTPRLRRLERLRFGSLVGRRSVEQHAAIIERCAARDAARVAEAVRENWLSLGTLIDRSFM